MGWGHVWLSRNCVILCCKELPHLLSAGWGSFPAALGFFPFRAAAHGAFFWQKLRLASCALKERLKGRWQNQTARVFGTFASWIWPLVFLAREFSFQPRSRSEYGVKLTFWVTSVASHNLISRPDLDKAAGFWLHWKGGLDQTYPSLKWHCSMSTWKAGRYGLSCISLPVACPWRGSCLCRRAPFY